MEIDSTAMPGVRLSVRRMSFSRRLELAREIRALGSRLEYLEAGSDPKERMAAAILAREIELIYLRWGLAAVGGLEVDGAPATPETLLRDGPEEIVREALDAIRSQCGLSQEERKN